ncbi:MAG: hypothetical protein KatS3mg017_0323 [Fimbriimonadales bacterium]|nr:MAG: hypothetical protein KatS3mg017_0323 [Fimbriimonadales bacterium]
MKRRYPHHATLTTLPVNTIYALLQRFCQLHPRPPKRGRPHQYPEPLILTLLLLGTREHASYRRLRFALARELLPNHPLPALGTLVYRFHHLTDERLHQLLNWLAQQGIAAEPATTETPCAFVDGTGVGYAGTFFAQYLRGAAVRRQRSHVKLVALGYWQGGRVWVAGLELGQAYAEEGRLLGAWVGRYGRGGLSAGTVWVGDRLYGHRARLLGLLEEVGFLPVMRVEDSVWQRVRAGSRLRARARAGVYGWAPMGRYRIEQVFGSVKGAYGSVCRARSWLGARVWVWGMFVLWNMVGLVQVWGGDGLDGFVVCCVWGKGNAQSVHHSVDGLDGFVVCCVWVMGFWVIFRTPSKPLDKSAKLKQITCK